MRSIEPKLKNIYLSLGSNIGDRICNIEDAVNLMLDSSVIQNIVKSSYYESEPYGFLEQDYFLNIALKAQTELSVSELLYFVKTVEYLTGRVIRDRWHSREIDIDIIFYDNLIINNKYVCIPHKEFRLRNFVLIPLLEIAPELIDPLTNKSISQLLDECNDSSEVYKDSTNLVKPYTKNN